MDYITGTIEDRPEEDKRRARRTIMDAAKTIEHFDDMGVLDEYIVSTTGRVLTIIASATEAYAFRCMKDFAGSDGYFKGQCGIDAVTTDGVPVVMTYV